MNKSELLMERHRNAVPRGVGTKTIYAECAKNAELWDVDGRHFIDFASGIAVNNTGHRHPRVMAAISKQAELFTHTCFHVAPFENYITLCERLNAIAPLSGPAKTMLVTTGAEAVENAIKVARISTGRSAVIAFSGAFHGRTMMGMALTGKVTPYKKGFGPFPADVYHAPFPNAFHGMSEETALAALHSILSADVDPDRIAAFIIEPIQGEGGFVPASEEFLCALRQLADQHGIVLIADEVQSGFARTGAMFALDRVGVKADIVTLAKGLGGGFPIAAVVGRSDLMDAAHPGGLGGTFAGNPLSVAASLAVLDIIEDEDLCKRASCIGNTITSRLQKLAHDPAIEFIGEIRGPGAMVAFEIVTDRQSRNADAELAKRIVQIAEELGLILLVCGTRFNVIRLLPPLTISEDLLDQALNKLEQAIRKAAERDAE